MWAWKGKKRCGVPRAALGLGCLEASGASEKSLLNPSAGSRVGTAGIRHGTLEVPPHGVL